MIIYHEAPQKDVEVILQNGLQRTSKGLRSQERLVIDTNDFLDHYRPPAIKDADIWRNKSIYGFVGDNDWIIEIKDGKRTPLSIHLAQAEQAVFKITPDVHYCYLSDLDLYDNVKRCLQADQRQDAARAAQLYWEHLVPAQQSSIHTILRPEVMIVRDLAPSELVLITNST